MSEIIPRLRSLGSTSAAMLTLAKGLFEGGRHAEALEQIDLVLKDNPELALAHFLKGLVMARLADFNTAAECLETTVQYDSEFVGAWLGLVYVRVELNLIDDALIAARRGLKIDPKNGNGHLLHGNVLARLDRPEEAIEAYRLAVKYNPQLMMAHYRLGYLLNELGRTDEAISQMLVSQRLNPRDSASRLTLGDIFRSLGKVDDAIDQYKIAAELSPLQGEAHVRIGDTMADIEKRREAMSAYKIAIRRDSRQLGAFLKLAKMYLEEGCHGEALDMAKAAIEIDARLPAAKEILERATKACDTAAEGGVDSESVLDDIPVEEPDESSID